MSDNFNPSKLTLILAGIALIGLGGLIYATIFRDHPKKDYKKDNNNNNNEKNKNNNNNNNNKRDKIILVSRASNLAMIQSEEIKNKLVHEQNKRTHNFGTQVVDVEIQKVATKGDQILNQALSKIGDKGLFTKELENHLLNREADIAVHSLKDMPTVLPKGLILGAIGERHNVEDCVVMHPKHKDKKFSELPKGSIIGSSSLRRIAQLKRLYPNFIYQDIRGNLNTRIRKLDEGQYDALILAVAGLTRLGKEFEKRIHEKLEIYYAVGQGALTVECRDDDSKIQKLLQTTINHVSTEKVCLAERSFLMSLEGGCQVPIGVKSSLRNETIFLKGIVLSLDGKDAVEEEVQGSVSDPEEIGKNLAKKMIAKGAEKILKKVREQVEQSKKESESDNN